VVGFESYIAAAINASSAPDGARKRLMIQIARHSFQVGQLVCTSSHGVRPSWISSLEDFTATVLGLASDDSPLLCSVTDLKRELFRRSNRIYDTSGGGSLGRLIEFAGEDWPQIDEWLQSEYRLQAAP